MMRRSLPGLATALLCVVAIGVWFGAAAAGWLAPTALSATITNPKPPEKKEEDRPCCHVGVSYLSGPGKVTLTQICNRGDRSIFYFRTRNLDSTCTHPSGTLLRDQKGRRYRMTSFSGIPGCSSGRFSSEKNMKFRWVFERLKPDVKKFTLLEVENEVTQGLIFWAWRDIDVSKCQM